MFASTIVSTAMVAIFFGFIGLSAVIGVLLLTNEKKKIIKASREGAKIEKMLENGQISKSEADELKRAIGIYSTLEDETSETDRHVTIVGILHIVTGLISIVALLLSLTILPHISSMELPGLGKTFALVLWMMLLFVFIQVIAGGFVLARKNWARYVVITFSIFTLPSFPTGTALGVYSLWALLFRKNASVFFDAEGAGYGTAVVAPTHISASAIWSLILGILGVSLLGPLGAVPAVICGHIAIKNIKHSNGAVGGRGAATAGLALGYAGIVIMVLALSLLPAMLIPALSKAKEQAQVCNSMNNLKQIALASQMYASDHDGAFPSNLQALAGEGYLPSLDTYTYPSTDTEPGAVADIDQWSDYVLAPNRSKDDPPDTILAFSKARCLPGKGGNIVTIEGVVHWYDFDEYSEITKEFQRQTPEGTQ